MSPRFGGGGGEVSSISHTMYFRVFKILGQEILLMSSNPGIFSEHEKKQVSHTNTGGTDRQTKRKRGKCEVEESSMQS